MTTGRHLGAMLTDPPKTLVLWGLEPDRDLADPARAMAMCRSAERVIACTAFRSPALDAVADVLLPIGVFAETSGTFVNASGTWQRVQGAVAPPGEARPGWKVLRVLGNLLDLSGFEYPDASAVHAEIAALCQDSRLDMQPRGAYPSDEPAPIAGMARVGSVPIYAIDPLVRRAPALQQTPTWGARFAAYLHPEQARSDGLAAGQNVLIIQDGQEAEASVVLDEHVPLGCVRIPAGLAESAALGAAIGSVELRPMRGETE
jgi:NADH-quinone oxidoreductase subunit G